MSRNVPPLQELPLSRFCNLVWYWATCNAEKEADVAKMEADLWRPPPGQVVTAGPWSPEAENASLKGLKASLGK